MLSVVKNTISFSAVEKAYFSTLSPAELLDRQLKLGAEIYQALATESKTEKSQKSVVPGK